jgi:hypothetical protein
MKKQLNKKARNAKSTDGRRDEIGNINIFVIQGNMILNLSISLCDMNNLARTYRQKPFSILAKPFETVVRLRGVESAFVVRGEAITSLSEILCRHLSPSISE